MWRCCWTAVTPHLASWQRSRQRVDCINECFFFAYIMLTSRLCVTSELHRSQVAAGGDGGQDALWQTLGPLHGAATAGPVRLPGVSFMAVTAPFKASCGERKTGDQQPQQHVLFFTTRLKSPCCWLPINNCRILNWSEIIPWSSLQCKRHSYSGPPRPVYTRCWREIRVEFNQRAQMTVSSATISPAFKLFLHLFSLHVQLETRHATFFILFCVHCEKLNEQTF